MTHAVELSEEAYQNLQRVADEEGVTPAEWITAAVSSNGTSPALDQSESAEEALAPFIGAVDSRAYTPDPKYRSTFGDILDEKFARQGINPARWER